MTTQPKALKLHYSRSKPNFGDALSPLICEAVSGRQIRYANIRHCDLIAVGSLLHRLPENWLISRKHVWGTGFISELQPYQSKHYLHALRGRYSAKAIHAGSSVALGDPGLLADQLISFGKPEKRFSVRIIEHYKDWLHPETDRLLAEIPGSVRLDVFSEPLSLLRKIQQCDLILSSAMHGLIAADSLSVPNAWLKLTGKIRGGDFKFRDYYSAFGLTPEPFSATTDNLKSQLEKATDSYYRPGIEQIKQDLINAFPRLS